MEKMRQRQRFSKKKLKIFNKTNNNNSDFYNMRYVTC